MHELRTPGESINQRNLKIWADVADKICLAIPKSLGVGQKYTYRVLQTIQMKLILLCVSAERAVLGSTKTALKFKYEI